MEDQPLPTDASPIALLPGYIDDYNLEEDEEDPEEDPVDYPANGGDNDDNESSDDDDDDDDVKKDEEDDEEEEHLALIDPSVVPIDDHETMTTVNQGMSVEEIERVLAQRVANAIEAIAIYEMKTNLAPKSMSQTERQEEEVVENASNKRRWEVKFHEQVDMIHGRMRTSKPKTMQDAMEIATKLRNKKISTLVECQTENKKRLDNTSKNNQNQRRPNKRQNTDEAYIARHGEKKHYGGSKPLCSKCNYHHDGPCAPKFHQCNKFGHLARDCRSSINANTSNIQKGTRASQKATCYECGNQGHYRKICPGRKNQNHENQVKISKARGVKHYSGSEPLCSKCNYHHDGPCAPKCHQCNRFGHLARDCRSSTNANATNIQKGTGASQKATCYECGNQGHYRRDYDEYNLQRGIQMSLESFHVPVSGVAIRELTLGITQKLPVVEVTQDASTGPFSQPQDDTSTNVIRDTPSPADAETGADTVKSNSEGDTEKVTP
nr:hypothetical protein [Tanacetum cinerariifolium]